MTLEESLKALAAAGSTTTYGALAHDLNLRIGSLTAALEALMEADAAANHPLRAALCEGRLSHGLPAEGFFLKAMQLGFDIPDRRAFVTAQRLELHRAHR